MLLLTSNFVRKNKGEDKNTDTKRATIDRTKAWNENWLFLELFNFAFWQIPRLKLKIQFKFEFFRNVYLWGWNLSWCGINNEDESVHCDKHDGERWEEDAAGLGGPDQLTQVLHVLAQGPILSTKNRNAILD